MPREPQFGNPLARADVGDKLSRANGTTRSATPPIEWRKYCVNSYAPSAQFQNLLNEATNQGVLYRTRQLFSAISHPNEIAALAATPQPTYRFAFRTSTYHSSLIVFATLQPPLGTSGNKASYAQLKIFSDTAEATVVATGDMYYGASPAGIQFTNLRGWSFAKTLTHFFTGLSPNTDYYACFYGVDAACLQTATVIETQSMTAHVDGYLPTTLTQESEVLAVYRQRVAQIQKQLWKYSGQSLLNWTVLDGDVPETISSATSTNVIDGSSTTVSASTPGYTLDMRYRARRGQTSGIPVVMKAFCSSNVWVDDPSNGIGQIRLLDSGGTAVLSIVDGFSAAGGWVSATGYLPATEAKYDLHFDNGGGGTVELWAVSIWEYEA